MAELSSNTRIVTARRYMMIGVGAFVASFGLLASAALMPTDGEAPSDPYDTDQTVPDITTSRLEIEPILAKIAGSRLIRPAQIQAAVKDTGVAQKLLERLKLQSIVQVGDRHVAYIRVKDEGVRTVRTGGHVLEFSVDSVAPGLVKLSLDGVVVDLTY